MAILNLSLGIIAQTMYGICGMYFGQLQRMGFFSAQLPTRTNGIKSHCKADIISIQLSALKSYSAPNIFSSHILKYSDMQ
jgi:hypothetical protein